MISIKKIMSVIAIAFAVMTIAGSGMMVTSFAANALDPCDGVVKGAASAPAGCASEFFQLFNFGESVGPVAGIKKVIAQVGTALIGILAAVSVVFLILGAYKMVTDGGDGKGFSAGKDNVKYAIIGLVVALLSYAIISVVIRIVT